MRTHPPLHLLSAQDMPQLFEHALHLAQDGRVGITEDGEVVAWLISAERYADLIAQCNLMQGQLSLMRQSMAAPGDGAAAGAGAGGAGDVTCAVPAAPSAG